MGSVRGTTSTDPIEPAYTLDCRTLDAPGVRKQPFLRQDHLVTALSGENAGLVMTLKKDGSALPSLAYGQHHP